MNESLQDDVLRLAWEAFLRDGDEKALAQAIASHPRECRHRSYGYPELHRIRDVMLCGAWYRVSRLAPASGASEVLIFEVTATPSAVPGVPYQLSGHALRAWLRDEISAPSKAPVDWSRYGVAGQ